MNYYNAYGNFCMEYSDENCEVMGPIIVDSGEILWRMKVSKEEAKYITRRCLVEHYMETNYSQTAKMMTADTSFRGTNEYHYKSAHSL